MQMSGVSASCEGCGGDGGIVGVVRGVEVERRSKLECEQQGCINLCMVLKCKGR
jgi:hypothetical protein